MFLALATILPRSRVPRKGEVLDTDSLRVGTDNVLTVRLLRQ
jgi:hypothetical protein